MKFLSFLILNFLVLFSAGEIFSAIQQLEVLAENERLVLEKMEYLISKQEENLNYMKRKYQLLKSENEIMRKDIQSYVTNPLNAFLLIKRMTSDIDDVMFRSVNIFETFKQSIEDLVPDDDDLVGAVEGLIRLQVTYQLKCRDLAKGIVDGKKTRTELRPHDLMVIGQTAGEVNQTFFEQSYLELTLENIAMDHDGEVDKKEIMFELAESYNQYGNYEDAYKIISDLLKIDPENENIANMEKEYKELYEQFGLSKLNVVDPYSELYAKNGRYQVYKENYLYQQACRGEILKSPEESKNLRCRFVSNSLFSKIAPFKVEEANLDPYVAIFYDVISDAEIKHLQNISKDNFIRAKVSIAEMKVSKVRIAQLHFIMQFDVVADRVSRRVGDMTGLNMKTAEALQVQNYGIGGHYSAHWDHTQKNQTSFTLGTGNRIATTLIYMSDVEKGGATVFPYMKIRVPPVKGSAVFWYNLRSSGEGYHETRHAGCPVLLGSKWVSNKWIHEYGQEFVKPCLPKDSVEREKNAYIKGFL